MKLMTVKIIYLTVLQLSVVWNTKLLQALCCKQEIKDSTSEKKLKSLQVDVTKLHIQSSFQTLSLEVIP